MKDIEPLTRVLDISILSNDGPPPTTSLFGIGFSSEEAEEVIVGEEEEDKSTEIVKVTRWPHQKDMCLLFKTSDPLLCKYVDEIEDGTILCAFKISSCNEDPWTVLTIPPPPPRSPEVTETKRKRWSEEGEVVVASLSSRRRRWNGSKTDFEIETTA